MHFSRMDKYPSTCIKRIKLGVFVWGWSVINTENNRKTLKGQIVTCAIKYGI